MVDLISVLDAQNLIISKINPVEPVITSLKSAYGRILAQDIYSNVDLPPFTNSSMDGFALRSTDVKNCTHNHPAALKIIGDIPAGSNQEMTIQTGQAARIMTGAMLPAGADAVIPLEDTNLYQPGGDQPLTDQVSVYKPVKAGDYIRPQGQDIKRGQTVLRKGRKLLPQDIGLLASIGLNKFLVFQRPRIAVLTTGDELIPASEILTAGKIHDSNSYMLSALVESNGGEIIDLGVTADDPAEIRERLQYAVNQSVNLILTSAGVSVGSRDFIRPVVEEHGQMTFWRVNMRPGKPVAFGHYMKIPLVGLPGNPVSAFVSFLILVLPALRKLSGSSNFEPVLQKAILSHPVESDGRESYLRAELDFKDGKYFASLTGHQGSGNLFALIQAKALLILPSGVKSLPSGSEVDFMFINGVLVD